MPLRSAFLCLAAVLAGSAQQPGPALSVDANAGRHAISPDIYGINFYWDLGSANDPKRAASAAAALDIRATGRRWGGNSTSTYHWKFDVDNLDADWFYEVLPDNSVNAARLPEGSSFNQFADQVRVSGGKIVGTMPVLGWLPKARAEMCSFDIRKYGSQCKIDPYAQYHTAKCGNGIVYDAACGDSSVNDGKGPKNPVYIKNDPTDAYAQSDESLQAGWVRYAVSRYGKANQGGIAIWSLDNEPIWWDTMHRDIHPDPYTYDEVLALDIRYAEAIKQGDATAMVSGPVGDNWASLWFSKKDIVAGQARGNYWSNPVDRNAHGGVAFLPWYLQQMRNYEQQHGIRLLDYLDQHAYLAPANVAFSSAGSAATQALRLDSTRVFWDPAYVVTGDYWIKDVENNGIPVAPRFIPRLREAASYDPAMAPGQMVVVWGSHMGPDKAVPLQQDSNGLVSSTTGEVRILFDGVPAPVVYASSTQCSAVVPYFGATKATTHVQVEYQGVRSEPVEFAVGATAPGLFTMDFSGAGQGAILNEDNVTRNSASAPARPGSVVVLWGTGEGITDPPGVDGRPAVDVLPKPLAPVSVEIGGLPAAVLYAGAAPGAIPGLFQINARISQDVAPGDGVPLRVKVGNLTSQPGVTVAVR